MSFLAVIDPNWSVESGGGRRGAQHHYELASVDAIAQQYRASPPWRDTGPGLLWMWATGAAILAGDAHALARSLGFRACAEWVWAKVDEAPHCTECGTPSEDCGRAPNMKCCPDCTHGRPSAAFTIPAQMGLGQWGRKEHEHLWLCRRGDVSVPPPPSRPRSMIYAPRGRHSEKPEPAWRVIETVSDAVLPGVIGCEWNARAQRPGWDAYGALDGEGQPLRHARAFEAGGSNGMLSVETFRELVAVSNDLLDDTRGDP
jgi:N6-adenosine-specific RNA methylase IME4